MIHSFPAPIIVHHGLTRGLIAEYAMHARVCISKSGHEHAHVEEQTPMRKFRGRLFTSGAHRCVPLRNARELCSRCAALFTR